MQRHILQANSRIKHAEARLSQISRHPERQKALVIIGGAVTSQDLAIGIKPLQNLATQAL